MTVGRKDYFWGVAPEKSVFGELQNSWTFFGSGTIGAGANGDYYDATILVGYIHNLCGLVVSCERPGINLLSITIDTVTKFRTYFDTLFNVDFGQGGEIIINYGENLVINITNNDSVSNNFYLNFYGFKQQIVV